MSQDPPRRPVTLDEAIQPPHLGRLPDDRASLEAIEERLHAELDMALIAIERCAGGSPLGYEAHAGVFAAMGTLAAALQNVRRVRATSLPDQPPAPVFDVDRLCADVWNAVQEAGASTVASDAAVDTIRRLAGADPWDPGVAGARA